MQTSTGKVRNPRKPAASKPLAPFDAQLRHTVDEAARHLKTSKPTIYKLINAGQLEAFKEGRRTFITGRSIAARSLPPAA
jgi:excisionase family DNA binding protein